jgi:predicted ABC-type transport system involved in lysophospholipase L1 biosynthesis ATPase subunit
VSITAPPRTRKIRALAHYLGSTYLRQYGGVVETGPPGDAAVPRPGAGLRIAVGGIFLDVPPGQSVALLSQPREVAVELLDVVAGLRRPGKPGSVVVGGVALEKLNSQALDRYRASRGLVSPRFPLLASRTVTGNVLAALPSARINPQTRGRAAELLALTGADSVPGLVSELTAEQQWRVLVARALLPEPRVVLAEDPGLGLGTRIPGEGGLDTPSLDARGVTAIWDLLMDMHALFGFTLLVVADRATTAIRCQRMVTMSGWSVTDDEPTAGDDPWTRGRVDRIG